MSHHLKKITQPRVNVLDRPNYMCVFFFKICTFINRLVSYVSIKQANTKVPTLQVSVIVVVITARCYAECGYEIVCCPSVRLSVCQSVGLSVTFRYVFDTVGILRK